MICVPAGGWITSRVTAGGADAARDVLVPSMYPPIAANLAVLCFGQVCPDAMIQTRQHLRCHRRVDAGVELVTTGRVARRYEKRGRTYIDIETTVAIATAPDDPVWTSEVSFTPAATLGAPR